MRHPAALAAVAVLGGAALGVQVPAPAASVLTIGTAAAWLCSIASFAWRAERAFAIAITVGFLLAGAALAAHADARAHTTSLRAEVDRRGDLLGARESVLLEGRLREDARPTEYGARLDLAVDMLSLDRAPLFVRGGVRLGVSGELAGESVGEWRAGRHVRLWAQLRQPTIYRNPGGAGADEERRLERQGIALVGSVKSARLVQVIGRGSAAAEAAADVRAFVRSRVWRHVGRRSAQAAGIITAILVGDRAGVSDEVALRLQEAGTYHVIAISGGNIAILAGMLLGLLRLFACPPRIAALITIACLTAYAVIVGDEASVERATAVAVLYLSARLLDHRAPPLNSLAAAAALLVAAAPLVMFDAGFVLSFGAAAALLIGVPRVVSWVRAHSLARDRACPRWLLGLTAMLAATLSAEIALLPVAASWFSRVTFAGFVLNLAAIPLMTVAQMAGIATVSLSALWTWGADRAGDLAWLAAAGLVESARAVELARWLVLRVPAPAAVVVVTYYAAWVAWLAAPRRPSLRRAALMVVALTAAVMVIAPRAPQGWWKAARLRVTFLDVAQGDATLVQFPGGGSLLVDAGGSHEGRFDIGGRIVAPALWRLGVRRLDYLAITHPDPDHAGGAAAIVRDFQPRAIWEGVPVPRDEMRQQLVADAQMRGIEWRVLQTGDRMRVGEVEIVTLHPPPPDWERQDARNDDSLVLDVRYGEVSILLTGDIGFEIERRLGAVLTPAALRVVKAPHHGSATSSSFDLIDAARPALVVISAGRGNPFGHPAASVLERYRAAGVPVLRTDLEGAITVETDGRSIEIVTWTGRRISIGR